MTTRVRFAPSPTGYLHIGSARTALFNYLFAKHTGGKFLLRIEDTDIERSTDASTRSILEGLEWLGFAPDEEIVYQSNNAPKHREIALKLLNEGKAYRDFTPKVERGADVKAAIVERAREQKDMRDNPFRDLSKEESDVKADAGEPFAIRLKVGASGKTIFDDAVYGLQERDYSEIEDLVLLRSDGHPLYNLAVVCDDIEMQITHVIRGQDHLTNTHKQVLIYEALEAEKPNFAHLPLILAPNKGKLSKRKHGEVVSMTTYRDAGFLAAAFRNFLVLLGWSAGEEQEIYTLDELIGKFSLDHIHKNNAVFNFDANDARHWTDDKAIWMNAEYVRTMPVADLLPFVKAELKSAKLWRDEYEDDDKEWFENTIDLIRQRFFTLKDFSQQGRAFFSEDFDFDSGAIAKNLKKFSDLQTWLPELADRFETVEAFTHDNIERVVKEFTEEKGSKMGVIMNGARVLLTGLAVGPSMLAVLKRSARKKRSTFAKPNRLESMNVNIKEATETDVPLIIAMIREFAAFENLSEFCEVTEANLTNAMFGESACVEGLTAFDGDVPIGYALFYQNFASFRGQRGFYLEDLYVKPEYRGRKIGEAFLRKLAQIAKSRNFVRIDFLVLDWNEGAIKFYKKFGAAMDESERHFKFTDQAFEKLSE